MAAISLRARTREARRPLFWALVLVVCLVVAVYTQPGQVAGLSLGLSGPQAGQVVQGTVNTIESPAQLAANKNMVREMAAVRGWAGPQWACLDNLLTRESGFNSNIRNPDLTTPGAYGIAQALGHASDPGQPSGLAVFHRLVQIPGGTQRNITVGAYSAAYGLTPAEARAANAGSAPQQAKWGLGYIEATYQTPCGAWAQELSGGGY